MSPQDSFIDEDEDSCPLCVEEFDLSDKNFWPCPCGYQICQFCYNNIKNNINGLCPACRRPYDEKNIEWKVVTSEEMAQFKATVQKNAKKKQEQRLKEAQKREVESMNRKHLSGLRVVQKNLVYVVGISPGIPEQEILSTLRGEKYFGQYGKIVKIVVSNKKQADPASGGQSLGVYVTFARKEDAARCIAAVNGSQNGDRVLRAQLGTTKYCSAYLRNETCTNKNCMFLHEPGDNDDSYSRQDLSSINSVNQQRPFPSTISSATSSKQSIHSQNLHSFYPQTQVMAREGSKDGSENGDGSALPSSASWGNRGLPQRSRRDSYSTNGATPSPAISQSYPATVEAVEKSSEGQHLSSENTRLAPLDTINTVEDKLSKNDFVLVNLLKAINSTRLSFPPPNPVGEPNTYAHYPPLFDEGGGRKRRAMRDQQKEIHHNTVKEFQEDPTTTPELLEEEEPEGGSLQLGGEPEDRDVGREGVPLGFHSHRQSGSQVPIQRVTNTSSFAPRISQAFPKNLSNTSSINGRVLTPFQQQQYLLMKSGQQSDIIDQYPPGIGNQHGQNSTIFHQQGHNKQASRYSFNNDNSSSSTAVKSSTNSKLISPQSSIMSAGNITQQTGFYPSIQGPPPGLKSSSISPANASIFTQNLGFGNSVSSALFGGLQKENNTDMLRDIIRSRGAVSGSQIHDTSKREYMFPSFLHQYPSASSTPAPGMASMYGPQTVAFHDFGQKQKKKGKKHRHVNTSSSGGGAIVDLTDPSILQARMQHQQNNSGVGQGLFGGLAQDDQLLPSLDDALSSVDALVGDNMAEDSGRANDTYSQVSRCSTPLIPPGFGLTHSNSSMKSRDEPIPRSFSRIIPTSTPFTPRRNFSSMGSHQAHTIPVLNQVPVSSNCDIVSSQQKKEVKLQQTIALKSNTSQTTVNTLQSEDFPALEIGKGKMASPIISSKALIPSAVSTTNKQPTSAILSTQISKSSSEIRSRNRMTNSTPTKTSQKGTDSMNSSKQTTAFPSLPPPMSASITTSANAQIPRNVPKTLRLTSTPKPETVPNVSSTSSVSSSIMSQLPVSRHPNLTSNIKLESPDTPTSDLVSDNASITSTSISQASSPPLNRVGSAPIRITTKSSQKKQRQAQKERGRAGVETVVVTEPEVEIAPIMGRKKKQKKDRAHNSTSGLASTNGRLQSPQQRSTVCNASKQSKEISLPEEETRNEFKESICDPVSSKTSLKTPEVKVEENDEVQKPLPSDSTRCTSIKAEEEPTARPPPIPAAIFQKLISSGAIKDPSELFFLKNVSSSSRSADLPEKSNKLELSTKLVITPEEHEILLAGKPVHRISESGHRIMLTPNGDCVRNLTEEEENRYLDYQAQLALDFGPATFISTKHMGQNGFTMIGGRAVPSGLPSYFPTPNKGNGIDAVSKIQRDEALNYINQYVLPTLSNNSQLDKMFNASIPQGDMICNTVPSDTSLKSWRSFHDRVSTSSGTSEFYMGNFPNSDGMIENITTHFTTGNMNRKEETFGPNSSNNTATALLSLSDAEPAMHLARKEADNLEKKLNALIKKNRRLLLGAGH